MTKYFQPIINFGPDPIKGSLFLSDRNFWFDKVKVLQRGRKPFIINSNDVPKTVIKDITNSFNLCGYKNRPLIMGVLNLSPDSFSNVKQIPRNKLHNYIENIINEGADIIDIGGESTKPNFIDVEDIVEIKRIKRAFTLKNGAVIFNDVSSLQFDPKSINVVKKRKCFVCLMHNSGNGKELHKKLLGKNYLLDIYDYLQDRINFLLSSGIPKSKIIIDPGIGFGKSINQNLKIISNINLFHSLGCPILVGLSRKGFIGKIIGQKEPKKRVLSSVILAFELIKKGVHIIRVHDIKETSEMFKIFNSLKSSL